jgi:hypothetical protein
MVNLIHNKGVVTKISFITSLENVQNIDVRTPKNLISLMNKNKINFLTFHHC